MDNSGVAEPFRGAGGEDLGTLVVPSLRRDMHSLVSICYKIYRDMIQTNIPALLRVQDLSGYGDPTFWRV